MLDFPKMAKISPTHHFFSNFGDFFHIFFYTHLFALNFFPVYTRHPPLFSCFSQRYIYIIYTCARAHTHIHTHTHTHTHTYTLLNHKYPSLINLFKSVTFGVVQIPFVHWQQWQQWQHWQQWQSATTTVLQLCGTIFYILAQMSPNIKRSNLKACQ